MTGSDVKQIRLQLGLTQTVFAYGLGVSRRMVESWEARPHKNIATGYALLFKHLCECHRLRKTVKNQGVIISARRVKQGKKQAWKTRRSLGVATKNKNQENATLTEKLTDLVEAPLPQKDKSTS